MNKLLIFHIGFRKTPVNKVVISGVEQQQQQQQQQQP